MDYENGDSCQVAYTFSSRAELQEAVRDLKEREGTSLENICAVSPRTHQLEDHVDEPTRSISTWAIGKQIDHVVWTSLRSNFNERGRPAFSVEAAIEHLQSLGSEGKEKAIEYMRNAPAFVDTPLRRAVLELPWFKRED